MALQYVVVVYIPTPHGKDERANLLTTLKPASRLEMVNWGELYQKILPEPSEINSELEYDDMGSDGGTETTAGTNYSDTASDATETASARRTASEESTRSADTIGAGVGLSSLDASRDRQKFMEIIDRLYRLGVQADVENIPQICLVGVQGSGKSSLIEANCGIKVPRATGTCTRCPIEIRINNSNGPWQCQIGLRYTYGGNGNRLSQPKSYPFGGPIMRPNDVEPILKDAFQALLNPAINYHEFINGKRPQSSHQSELSFSKNCITVHIQGPELSDLAFVDLPGLIASARGGRVEDIGLIESLITEYIKNESCLILLAVSCESDFETQSAYQLAKRYDPNGTRTIGVLTKPDRIESGNEEQWLNLLKNFDEPLELGWYCVKLPDSSHVGMRWEDAREAEEEWFSMTRPWCTLPQEYQGHLGTQDLVEHLSAVLAEFTKRRLPGLLDELDELLNKAKDGLQALPAKPSSNCLSEIMHLVTRFASDVKRHTDGIAEKHGLIQGINSLRGDFKKSLLSNGPSLKPYKASEAAELGPLVPPIELLEGEEEDRLFLGMQMHIDEVMELLTSSRTRELPDAYPDAVPKRIVDECKQDWPKFAEVYCEEVYKGASEHLKKLVDDYFRHYEAGGLHSVVQSEVQSQLSKCKDVTSKRLEWLADVEHLPFTLSSEKFLSVKNRFLGYYKLHRSNALNSLAMGYLTGRKPSTYIQDVIDNLARMGFTDVKELDLAKLLPEDRYEPALCVMASVSAYYTVASRRYLDFVPGIVDKDLIRAFSDSIQTSLLDKIMSGNASERCRQLMQESPALTARRDRLQQRFTRLEAAKMELASACI